MKSAPIAIVTLLLAAGSTAGPASAAPALPHPATIVRAPVLPLLEVRHRRYRRTAEEPAEAAASSVIKPGAWQFNAELQSALPAPAVGQGTQNEAGFQAPYTICIDAQRPVPSALGPRCKLDKVGRQNSDITWSITCTNPEGAVHSDGVAQYHGDTMEASVVSHLPNAAGKVTDISQRITGHYLGSCTTTAANADAAAPQPPWVEPPPAGAGAPAANSANSGTAVPPPAATPGRAATVEAPPPETYHRRYSYHHRHYRRHYRYYSRYYRPAVPFPFSLIFGR